MRSLIGSGFNGGSIGSVMGEPLSAIFVNPVVVFFCNDLLQLSTVRNFQTVATTENSTAVHFKGRTKLSLSFAVCFLRTLPELNSFSISSILGGADFRLSGNARVNSYSEIPIGFCMPRNAYSFSTVFLSCQVFNLFHLQDVMPPGDFCSKLLQNCPSISLCHGLWYFTGIRTSSQFCHSLWQKLSAVVQKAPRQQA